MDQVKEILRQAIKYRFWIAVGIAALMPVIAYFATAGSLNAETVAEKNKIETAEKDVKNYTSGNLPNADYTKVVNEKTEVVNKDVEASWRKLYERQAPLLKWPAE